MLAERVAQGEVTVADFDAEVARIKKLPSPYNRWLAMVAAACLSGALSQFAGGDSGSFGIAFVAAGVGQVLRSQLQARNMAAANVTLMCGVLSACIASVALRAGLSQVAPVTLIASVVYLAPGLPLINGFADVRLAQISIRGNRADRQRCVSVPDPGDRHCAGIYRHPVDADARSPHVPLDDCRRTVCGQLFSPQGLASYWPLRRERWFPVSCVASWGVSFVTSAWVGV